MKTIKSSGVYRSENVNRDVDHHHKIWQCEIVQINGFFHVKSKAQLFVQDENYIIPEKERTYSLGTYTNIDSAEKAFEQRIRAKRFGKSQYTLMFNHENNAITADEATIIAFLQKYSIETH